MLHTPKSHHGILLFKPVSAYVEEQHSLMGMPSLPSGSHNNFHVSVQAAGVLSEGLNPFSGFGSVGGCGISCLPPSASNKTGSSGACVPIPLNLGVATIVNLALLVAVVGTACGSAGVCTALFCAKTLAF